MSELHQIYYPTCAEMPLYYMVKYNLHDPSLLPTLQFTLQCMGHAQKCITGISLN